LAGGCLGVPRDLSLGTPRQPPLSSEQIESEFGGYAFEKVLQLQSFYPENTESLRNFVENLMNSND